MASTIAEKTLLCSTSISGRPGFCPYSESYANRAAREKYGREFREIFGLAKYQLSTPTTANLAAGRIYGKRI
jgi:hypothetical protein